MQKITNAEEEVLVPGRLLSISEIQKIFGRSRTWVWQMRKEGKIRPSAIDSRRFPYEEIMRITKA